MTEQEVQFTVRDVAAWDDAKCQELEGKVNFPLVNIRNLLREFTAMEQKLQTLRTVIFKGMLRGYTIKCPVCNETYNVSVSDFNRISEVVCPKCGKPHKQSENIVNVVIDDNVPMEKPKKKRVSKKKVAKV
jgi:Zn ribbon nucleic-acid-binding protein